MNVCLIAAASTGKAAHLSAAPGVLMRSYCARRLGVLWLFCAFLIASPWACAQSAASLQQLMTSGLPGALAGSSSSAVADEVVETFRFTRHPIAKSERDKRRYSYITLANGLRVVLVSDPEAEKAAAALSVQVGAMQNPPEREGLAHFLEHMLFLGTEKYPAAGEYQAFISQHGGAFNAYTSLEKTTYFFDIDAASLEPALDRFAQFFIAPLFSAEYVERERQAVDAEFMARLKDDGRREWEVLRELLNPAHPGAKFTVGNKHTLGDREGSELRDELIAFYRAYYSADVMNLVVVGRETTAQLENWVASRFSKVPVKPENANDASALYPPLIERERLPMTVEIQPERDLRRLSFNFPLRLPADVANNKPYEYIARQLAHQGKGSLLSFLKRLGWAEDLTAGLALQSRQDAFFQVNIELTPQGIKARDQMVSLVFYSLEQLRARGIASWRYQEMQEMALSHFLYEEKRSPQETARVIAEAMFDYESEQVLYSHNWFEAFDERQIKEAMQPLNADNLLLMLIAPETQAYRISRLYSVPYSVRYSLPAVYDLKPAVKQELALAERNPFVARRLAVKSNSLLEQSSSPLNAPQLVLRERDLRLWFAQDHLFDQPKAVIQLQLKLPMVAASVEGAAQAALFAALLNDQLNEYAYPARLAGVEYQFDANARGFVLQISGFASRQNLLLDKIISAWSAPVFKPERFENLKQKLLRDLRNRDKNLPFQVLMQEVPALQLAPAWRNSEMIAALENIDVNRLRRFADLHLIDAKMDMLVYGNYFRQEALKLAVLASHNLLARQTGRAMPPAMTFNMPQDGNGPWLYTRPLSHSDANVQLLIPPLAGDIDSNAQARLLQQIIKPAFYTQLRTEKQLGYVVAATAMPLRQLDASLLLVQSPVASEAELIGEIETFLQAFEPQVTAELEVNRRSLATKLREPARSLSDQANRYWQAIELGDYTFSRNEALAVAVESVNEKTLQAAYRALYLNPARRLWLVSNPLANSEAYRLLQSPAAYHLEQDAYPTP